MRRPRGKARGNDHSARSLSAPRRDCSAGFTLVEILLVTSMLGMILLVTLNGWTRFRRHTVVRSSARLAGLYLHHARMDAVYDGVNHFVVLDPDASTIEIYADTGTVSGSFDSTDVRV
ncbi:MAG: Tfp pilus assembly protein FimT/FimU, partial [Acidobacteriota bacterium]